MQSNEMLSLQKSASDRTGLGYDFSFSSIASTSTTVFVSPVDNIETERVERKQSLLGMTDLFDFKLVTSLKC